MAAAGNDQQDSQEQVDTTVHFGFAEVLALGFIWGFGFAICALVMINYHGDQSVSLENIIAYVMAAVVLVSGIVLFRDAIARYIEPAITQPQDDDCI